MSGALEATLDVARPGFHLRVELRAAPGETIGLLGPNGAGKTTVLRALAGLVPLRRGRIELDGRLLDDPAAGVFEPPERRSVGVVFQEYLLFPHLDAADNVAFGLRSRGVHRREARRQAVEWLDRVGLADRAGTPPSQLSGGQAQRVALARALAARPDLLLLDEPLAALDTATRNAVRHDLRRHLASFAGIRLVVTHDPIEAAALADRLVIVEGGQIVQQGAPDEIAAHPRSRYIAELVGTNLFHGQGERGGVRLSGGGRLAVAAHTEGEVLAVVHPRAVALHPHRPEGTPRNVWETQVTAVDQQHDRVRVRLGVPIPIVAEVTPAAVRELGLVEGRPVWVSVKATEVDVYPA